jgi:cytosine/adenosine deaminase-related metal-dependent hydrolase
MTSSTFSLKARYLFPVDRPPIENGWITVADGRIAAVGDAPTAERVDLGDVAILPGWINAHTHLEFSELTIPLGEPGIAFTNWIREVIKWRIGGSQDDAEKSWQRAIRCGLDESLRCGTTTIGEIAKPPTADAAWQYDGMHGVAFWEVLGLAPEREGELFDTARRFIAGSPTSKLSLRAGISPHAPYTVSPRMLEQIVKLSANVKFPVAMHLAETVDELELLRSRTGPFVDFLRDVDAWYPESLPRNARPLDYLQTLATADRALVVHGNYLTADEIEFLGSNRERMSVIYCPRTHAYFGHAKYPLAAMLRQGVNVALGTDSRGSNPDLDILGEVCFVALRHTDILPEQILRMATINAAEALGVGSEVGSLKPGKRADLTVVSLPSEVPADPYEAIVDPSAAVNRVYHAGQVVTAGNS